MSVSIDLTGRTAFVTGSTRGLGRTTAEWLARERAEVSLVRQFSVGEGVVFGANVVVHAGTVAHIPGELSFPDAAAIPEAFVTAWDAMIGEVNAEAAVMAV